MVVKGLINKYFFVGIGFRSEVAKFAFSIELNKAINNNGLNEYSNEFQSSFSTGKKQQYFTLGVKNIQVFSNRFFQLLYNVHM